MSMVNGDFARPSTSVSLTLSPNHNFDSNLVAPPSMLIRFLPCPDSIDFENVFALLIDLNAFCRNGSTEYYGHEVVLNRAFLEVRDIETYNNSVVGSLNKRCFVLDDKKKKKREGDVP